jgi:hypothetical protein
MIEEAELQLANMGDKIQEEVRKIIRSHKVYVSILFFLNLIRTKSKNKRVRKVRKE